MPTLSRRGHWLAAVRACGEEAVLSHRDGAALYGIRPNNRWRIEVTTRTQAGRRIKRIQTHHGKLTDADVTIVDAVPVTTLARTLLDLAEVVDGRQLARRFLALCRAAGIPLPEVNRRTEDKEVDFRWPEYRLIAETDGWSTHRSRRAFQRDRERDRQLAIARWRVVRFTWYDVVHRPQHVAADLRALLQTPLVAV